MVQKIMSETLSSEERDILLHTMHRAAGGLYCGSSPEMITLIKRGLMVYAGRKSLVPDPYYRITPKGCEAIREQVGEKE